MYFLGLVSTFPEMFEVFSKKGLIGQAIQNQRINFNLVNPREFVSDIHKSIDDRPYGGGDGMIMLADPLEKSVARLKSLNSKAPVIYLSPQGTKLTNQKARLYADLDGIIMICGRYGGIDERFVASHVDEELSVGDYILNGGEVAAMCVIESVTRFVHGVLGNQLSAHQDSFSQGLLEAPQMTRPPEYAGLSVPKVLMSGDHKAIASWRRATSLLRTFFRRPELLGELSLQEEIDAALEIYFQMSANDRRASGLPPGYERPIP